MTSVGSLENGASAKSTGTSAVSVITETIDSGDSITVDGTVLGGAAFAQTSASGSVAYVTSVSGADVTVEVINTDTASTITGTEVTVMAIVG